MHFGHKIKFIKIVLFAAFFASSNESRACNVPVFRYALERWDSDFYTASIFYDSSIDSTVLAALTNSQSSNSQLNLISRTFDITQEPGKSLAKQYQLITFPWIIIQYPPNVNVRGIVWEDEFSINAVEKIKSSPARTTIASHLLAGDAAVWVHLKSDNIQKNECASRTLQASLEKAALELSIPKSGTDIDGNAIEVDEFEDFELKFSFIEISRDDPAEQVLVQTLLGTEPDLFDSNEPIAFPVFGRGRALYAILGNGIREQVIMDACSSIIAWCSCEIKDLNPGTDLLLKADWSNPVGGQLVKEELPELTGFAGFIAQSDSTEKDTLPAPRQVNIKTNPIEKADPVSTVPEKKVQLDSLHQPAAVVIDSSNTIANAASPSILRNVLFLIGAAFLVLIASTLFFRKKKN
jgi:hypothetical protein